MHLDKNPDTITLATAARLLSVSYQAARNLLLRGQVDGGRDEHGHWWVKARSVQRYAQRRMSARMQSIAP